MPYETTHPDSACRALLAMLTLCACVPGYVFPGWSGDVADSTEQITMELTGNLMVTANFEKAD